MFEEALVYQRIGEFVVSFQWLENRVREIGWFILDPDRRNWPPKQLRNVTNEQLIDKVHELFLQALPKCELGADLEAHFHASFTACAKDLHQLRRSRNRFLHSAFIEFKAGGEVVGLLRSNPRLIVEDEGGQALNDQSILTPDSFVSEMLKMGEVAMFLNRAFAQLIQRYPHGEA